MSASAEPSSAVAAPAFAASLVSASVLPPSSGPASPLSASSTRSASVLASTTAHTQVPAPASGGSVAEETLAADDVRSAARTRWSAQETRGPSCRAGRSKLLRAEGADRDRADVLDEL